MFMLFEDMCHKLDCELATKCDVNVQNCGNNFRSYISKITEVRNLHSRMMSKVEEQ